MKTKRLLLIIPLFLSAFLLFLSACNDSVSVKFDANGGSAVQEVKNKTGYTIEVEPVTTKKGYNFTGWFDGETKVDFPYKLSKNVTLKAKWDIVNYTVTFHSEGGSEVDSFTYTVDDEDTYFIDPERPGYSFTGWFNNSNKQGFVYLYLESGSTGDKEFWAGWNIANYNITYNANGGTVSEYAVKTYNVETPEIQLFEATRTGYTFVGWFDNPQLNGTEVKTIPTGSYGHKTYYANWVPTEYNVTFELYDGEGAENFKYTIEDEDIELPIPSKTGYEFAGWYTSNTYSGTPVTKIVKGSTGDIKYFAKWDAVSYGITYELNGGQFNSEYPQSYTVAEVEVLVAPRKTGFVFAGWYDNPGFTGQPYDLIPLGSTGDKKFYAKWEVASFDYSITLNPNGGTLPQGYPQGYYEGTSVNLPTPTRAGANFAGWYDNSSFTGTPVTEIKTTDTGNKEFWAKWNLIEYTITYELNGGEGATNTTYNVASPTITLPIPTKSGFDFAGWYTNPEFTGQPVTTIPTRSTGDKAFYAKWEDNTEYTISYNTYGGSFTTEPKKTYKSSDATFTLPIPVRPNYIFKGWKDNIGLTGDSYSEIPTGSSGHKSFYAAWEAATFSITYELNGGTGPTTGSYTFKEVNPGYPDPILNYVLPIPTRSGYTFAGWYTSSSLTDSNQSMPGSGAVSQIKAGTSGDKVFYAKWIQTPVSSTTKTFEAENTDLMEKSGSGWSGSQSGAGMIFEDAGASGGKYVGYLTNEGSFLDFYITSDRVVNNATLDVTFNMEMIRDVVELKNIIVDSDNYSIIVNGQYLEFSIEVISGDDPNNLPLTTLKLHNVNLLAGENVIILRTGQNTYWNDERQAGPGVDCIKLTAAANLSWTPIFYD